MENIVLSPEMLAVIPGIMLVIQLLKKNEAFAKLGDWLPFVSIGLGIAWAVFTKMGVTVPAQVVAGVLMGIAASGGYDATRTIGNPTPTK